MAKRLTIAAALGAMALSLPLFAQEAAQEAAPPAADPAPDMGATATPAADVVEARRALMSAIQLHMYPLEEALAEGSPSEGVDTYPLLEHASSINAMLLAFPHLFPAGTEPGAEGVASDASPEIWNSFDDFYAIAREGAQAAIDVAYAASVDDMRAPFATLQQTCSTCHDAYLDFGIPQLGSDVNLDVLQGL